MDQLAKHSLAASHSRKPQTAGRDPQPAAPAYTPSALRVTRADWMADTKENQYHFRDNIKKLDTVKYNGIKYFNTDLSNSTLRIFFARYVHFPAERKTAAERDAARRGWLAHVSVLGIRG